MEMTGNELISVTRSKGDYKSATVKINNLDGFHWDTTSGGARVYTGTYNLYAYMSCDKIEKGEIGHSGIHGPCPHNIKVYISKGSNEKYFNYIARGAGEKPENPNKNALGTAVKIRKLISNQPGITAADVANILADEGVSKKTVQNMVRYLKSSDFKTLPKLRSEKYKNTQRLYLVYSNCDSLNKTEL